MGKVSADILRSNMAMSAMAKEAMAEWVKGLGLWRLFVTLTLAPPSQSTGNYSRRGYAHAKRAWGQMVEYAEARLGSNISYFYVIEEHHSGVPHLHGLVGPGRNAAAAWGVYQGDFSELAKGLQAYCTKAIGFSRVKPLDPERGAEAYVCKYCVKGDTLWEYRE